MKMVTRKTLFRSIKKSFGRFIAIFAITALGVGFFAGLKVSKDAMVNTYDTYLQDAALFDFHLLSTMGLDDEDAEAFAGLSGISAAEGSFATDALVSSAEGENAYRIMTLTESINKLEVVSGRLPQAAGEIFADASLYDESNIGDVLTLSDNNTGYMLDNFSDTEYAIVGTGRSPLYIGLDRGTTSLAGGELEGFLIVHPSSVTAEYYTDLYLTLDTYETVYTPEYDLRLASMEPAVSGMLALLAEEKHADIVDEVEAEQQAASNKFADLEQAAAAGQLDKAGLAELAAMATAFEDMPVVDIPEAQTYVLDRETLPGHVNFQNDTQIVSGISNIFPVFFFMVAVLVCITTMTRMVDEERTQIGALKALGYSDFEISKKYLLYAGVASLLGWAAGFVVGTAVIPQILWLVYSALYSFASLSYLFSPALAIGTLVVTLAGAIFAVVFACVREMREVPAESMRPKAPKAGKRILLERVPLLWDRLSFLMKVSVRNVFRDKKRLVMMILGVSGCTALLVAGFGIRDSVQNVAGYQFEEIMTYDMNVSFTGGTAREEAFLDDSGYRADQANFVYSASADLVNGSLEEDATLIVTETAGIAEFINFHADDVTLSPPADGQVLLSSQLAKQLELGVGDLLTIEATDDPALEVTVSGIFDNYVGNYAFVSSQTAAATWGEAPVSNAAFIKLDEGADPNHAAAGLLDLDSVSNVVLSRDLRARIDDSLSSINSIVIMVVVGAAALAFVVLYNLTNINIIERVREIATVGVIGFFRKETSAYVLRENVILAGVGGAIGLVLGKLLHSLIMSMIVVDNVAFDVRVMGFSYVISFVLTLVFAFLVNGAMLRKLDKIPMAESLKTVE